MFDDMNVVIIATKLFITVQKLIMSFNFISLQLYVHLSKDARANTTQFFITNIPNRRELQEIAINCSFNNDFDEFRRLYRNLLQSYIQYLFLVICTLPIRWFITFLKRFVGITEIESPIYKWRVWSLQNTE